MRRLSRCLLVFAAVAAVPPAAAGRAQEAPAATSGGEFAALQARAEEARIAGTLDLAIELYKQAVALRPGWIEGYWYLGTSYYSTDQFALCRDAFARVVEAQPENGAAWAFKGLCTFEVRDYDRALADLLKSQELGIGEPPELIPVARYHRALLLTRSGQYERALQLLTGFAREGADAAALTEAMGLALLRLPLVPAELPPAQREMVLVAGRAALTAVSGDIDAARKAYEELVARYPDTPNVHYAYGGFLLRDHPEDALAEFREELRRSPGHAPAMVQIAQELINQNDFEGALPPASEAARIAPRNFLARRILGQVKLATGDVPGAVAELEAAVALEPTSPGIRYHLARAYQRAGRTADAAREREEFTRLERQLRVQRGGANAVGEQPPP